MNFQTKSARMRRQRWLRAGVWAFIFVFAFSIVGGALALIALGGLR